MSNVFFSLRGSLAFCVKWCYMRVKYLASRLEEGIYDNTVRWNAGIINISTEEEQVVLFHLL